MTDPVMKCRSPQFDPIFGSTKFNVGAFGNTSRKAATISLLARGAASIGTTGVYPAEVSGLLPGRAAAAEMLDADDVLGSEPPIAPSLCQRGETMKSIFHWQGQSTPEGAFVLPLPRIVSPIR